MTDPNAPTLDPVEDRLRRTFAARAEDMAPGDPAGTMPDLDPDDSVAPHRIGGTRRPVLAAAAVVIVVATTAGIALVAREGDRDPGRTSTVTEQPPPAGDAVAATTAPRAVLDALRNERDFAWATLTGTEDAIALPVTDTGRARLDTDTVVASFAAFVTASPDGAAYQRSLDALVALGELRGTIDADTGPRTLDHIGPAGDIHDRYTELIGVLLDDQQTYAETVDDPMVRTGAVAYGRGLRLSDQSGRLVHASLVAVILPGTESAAELTQLHADVQHGLDTIVSDTTGTPFEEAAATLAGDLDEAGLLEATGDALDGNADLAVIMDASQMRDDEGWPAFLDQVEETLATLG